MTVSRVPPDQVESVWPWLLAPLNRALRHGDGDCTTAECVLADLKSGESVLWVVHEDNVVMAGLVLTLRSYPAKRTLAIDFAAGGDMDQWADIVEPRLREFAELCEADTIECSCRPGLVKKLLKRGWRRKATIMELP